MVYNTKKAQSLPLNTIVIALLVVVVLVVIILAFTTNIGGFNTQVNEVGGGNCNAGNPAIAAIYGSNANIDATKSEQDGCDAGFSRVPGVSGNGEGTICCAQRANSNQDTSTD
ncbi:MAG: hypothetical protein LAT82_05115 [Nanoarchaeota archaeon]|nr:hypothetical protein [Nanoarchaeota archaeon]